MKNKTLLTPYFIDAPLPGLRQTAKKDWEIHDPILPPGTKIKQLTVLYPGLADWVARTAANGYRPVSVAGDCCTSIAVLSGLQQAGLNPLLIWFDAHGDFNTWETTPSGFLGGMPLAMLVGLGDQEICKAVGLTSFPESQVILSDGRDLDPGERELVERSKIRHLKKIQDIPAQLPGNRPIWVHFDTDVLSPDEAPAMNYPTPGGPSADELGAVFDEIRNTGLLAAVSVSSWNPAMDKDRKTEQICMALLSRLISI